MYPSFSDARVLFLNHISVAQGTTTKAIGDPEMQHAVQQSSNPPSTSPPQNLDDHDVDFLLRHIARHAIPLRDASSSFSRRYLEFAPKRAEVLLLRFRAESQRNVNAEQLPTVSGAQKAFVVEARQIIGSLPPGYSVGQLDTLLHQVAGDHERQTEHTAQLLRTATQLSKAEYDLQQQDYLMAQAARKMAEVFADVDLILNQDAANESPTRCTAKEDVQKKDVSMENDPKEDVPKDNDGENFARLFRQARRLIDEALIKRTQWTQELDRFAHSRSFLRNSTGELMSHLQHSFESQSAHPKEREKRKKRTERTQEILRETPVRRGEIDSPPTTNAPTELPTGDSAESSRGKAQTESDSGIGSSRPELALTLAATKLYEQYCEDYDAVMKQEEIVKRLTNELSNLEYLLDVKEQEMKERMRSENVAAELRAEMLASGLGMSDSSNSARYSNATPPLVREYFERQGDVGIWRERLVEWDYAHEEGKIEREFFRERGDNVDPPDEEFEFNYFSRREHIHSELRMTQRDAEALKRKCNNAGLNPESHRESMAYMQSDDSPAPLVADVFDRDQSPSPVQAVHIPAPVPQPGNLGTGQRINEWLRELSTTPGSGEPEQIEYVAAPPRSKDSGDIRELTFNKFHPKLSTKGRSSFTKILHKSSSMSNIHELV